MEHTSTVFLKTIFGVYLQFTGATEPILELRCFIWSWWFKSSPHKCPRWSGYVTEPGDSYNQEGLNRTPWWPLWLSLCHCCVTRNGWAQIDTVNWLVTVPCTGYKDKGFKVLREGIENRHSCIICKYIHIYIFICLQKRQKLSCWKFRQKYGVGRNFSSW